MPTNKSDPIVAKQFFVTNRCKPFVRVKASKRYTFVSLDLATWRVHPFEIDR